MAPSSYPNQERGLPPGDLFAWVIQSLFVWDSAAARPSSKPTAARPGIWTSSLLHGGMHTGWIANPQATTSPVQTERALPKFTWGETEPLLSCLNMWQQLMRQCNFLMLKKRQIARPITSWQLCGYCCWREWSRNNSHSKHSGNFPGRCLWISRLFVIPVGKIQQCSFSHLKILLFFKMRYCTDVNLDVPKWAHQLVALEDQILTML